MSLIRLSVLKSARVCFISFIVLALTQTAWSYPAVQVAGLRQASFFPSDIAAILASSNVQIEELTLDPPYTVTITGFYRNETLEVTADLVIREGSLLLDIMLLELRGVDQTLSSTRVDLERALTAGLGELIDGEVESFEIRGNSLIVIYATSFPTPIQIPTTIDPSLSSENTALLDRSVNNTTNANSLAFSVDSEITVEREDGDLIFDIQGEGNISQISDPQAVQLDLTLEITAQQGEDSLTIIIQQRIIDGMLYVRGIVEKRTECTRWITSPFATLFSSVIMLFSEPSPFTGFIGNLLVPADAQGNASDLGALSDLLDLLDFGRFASTSRIDVEGTSARFRTEINVLGFLNSPELVSLITLFVRLGGIDLDRSQPQIAAHAFQTFLPVIVPELDLSIYRTIDPERQMINGIRIDGAIIVNAPTVENSMLFHQTQIELTVNARISQIGDVFTVEVPESPVYVSGLDELQTISREELITQECAL